MKTRFFTSLIILLFTCHLLPAQVWEERTPPFANTTMYLQPYASNDTTIWTYGFETDETGAFTFENYEIFRSTNSGQSWQSISFPHTEPGYLAGISALSDQVAWIAYVDYANGQKILKTLDGGQTWDDQPNGLTVWIDLVHFFNIASGVAMGDPNDDGFEIYTSGNSGASWDQVDPADIPPALPGEYSYNSVFDVIGNKIWFETNLGRVYYSINQGYTWEVFEGPHGQTPFFMVAVDELEMCYVVYVTFDASGLNPEFELFRTPDNGATWEDITPEDNDYRVDEIHPVPGTGAIIGSFSMGWDSGVYETRLSYDQGITWQTIDIGNHTLYQHFYDANTGVASGVIHTQDSSYFTIFNYIGSPLTGLLNREQLNVSLKVSPNPASDFARVQITSPVAAECWLLLNDANGRLLHKEVIEKTDQWNTSIDMRDLPAGVYTVTVSNAEGMVVQKVVKQ